MAHAKTSAVAAWRKRRQSQGFVRLEVQVRKEDVSLVKEVVAALDEPERASATRASLRENVLPQSGGLKALLESAPLDGIDLERPRDFGRDVSL